MVWEQEWLTAQVHMLKLEALLLYWVTSKMANTRKNTLHVVYIPPPLKMTSKRKKRKTLTGDSSCYSTLGCFSPFKNDKKIRLPPLLWNRKLCTGIAYIRQKQTKKNPKRKPEKWTKKEHIKTFISNKHFPRDKVWLWDFPYWGYKNVNNKAYFFLYLF